MDLAVITSLKTQSVVAVTPTYEGTSWKLFQKVMRRISIILQYKEYYTVTSFLSMKELIKRRIFSYTQRYKRRLKDEKPVVEAFSLYILRGR